MSHVRVLVALALASLVLLGCAVLDEKQREWIFQPGDRSWGDPVAATQGMDDVWIDIPAGAASAPERLHGLWMEGARPDAPVVLYLHGARWNIAGSAFRMRRLNALGFAVLGIDYRGFGKSSMALPSEESAYQDARAAWDWLGRRHPQRHRLVFGHSLGGAIAITLASRVDDERGTWVEGTFTSIRDVIATMRWGWLPIGPLLTQRFDAQQRVGAIGSPLLVVHGEADQLIHPELGRRLFDAARDPKAFVLVPGGSHHNAQAVGMEQVRQAVGQLFGVRPWEPAG